MNHLLAFLLLFISLPAGIDSGATVYTPTINLPKKRTLVLLDSLNDKSQFSTFFSALEIYADVTYEDKEVPIKKYGEYLFDNILIFGVKSGKDLNTNYLEFVDAGNNVVIVSRPLESGGNEADALPETLREAAIECGVSFSDSNVVDNFNNAGEPDVITTKEFTTAKPVFGGTAMKELNYRGLAMQLEQHNPLLFPIVTAQATAFTAPIDEGEDPQIIGTNAVLGAGLQTRIGSRMAFVGSVEVFSDDAPQANVAFAKATVRWAFQFGGVLRYSEISHEGKEKHADGVYRIRDHITYRVKIEEFTGENWVPFKASDVQLEFTMIDAYIRQPLQYDTKKNDGTYALSFQAPDVYGIYKFVVDYRRTGYSPLIFYTQTTVRPLKLNEYERFIESAFPYYSGVFACMFGFLLFSLTFLYIKE